MAKNATPTPNMLLDEEEDDDEDDGGVAGDL
jgi:hypothetical protein